MGVRATQMYIVPYKKEWQSIYSSESEKICKEISSGLELHHIGSTAISGLNAKDCVDILGVIESFELGKGLVKPLESLGFIYKGEYGIAKRHYFSKPCNPKVHLHICPIGHEQIERHLKFVTVMNGNKPLIKRLNEFKSKLAEQFPKEIYQLEKRAFYEEILATKL